MRDRPIWWQRSLLALTQPQNLWTLRTRVLVTVVGGLLCTVLSLAHLSHGEGIFQVSDAAEYAGIARGDVSQVMQPFASRPLGAMVAGALTRGLHCGLQTGFEIEATFSLLLTFGIVFWLMTATAAPRWMLPAVASLWFWQPLVQYMVLPDLWYAAMLSVLLLMLQQERSLAAALWMFPLMLSRESTLLTLACFLIVAWGRLRWSVRATAVLATAAASALVSRLARGAHPNAEHLPGAAYMLAKVPWNFARNVLGLRLWSNVNRDLCNVPAWQTNLHLGPVTAVGICQYSSENQLIALWALLSNFGLLPLLCAFLWWRCRRWHGEAPILRFALLYGSICVVLTPLLGAGMVHLLGYSWPLFLIAPPLLFANFTANVSYRGVIASSVFFVLHLAACALTIRPSILNSIAWEAALWVAGFLTLQTWFPKRTNAKARA